METALLTQSWCRQAWCQPFYQELEPLQRSWPGMTHQQLLVRLTELARERQLRNANGQPLEFVEAGRIETDRTEPDRVAVGPAYESWIYRTGQIPTRSLSQAGWHDIFNALVWLAFPRAKALLNQFQAQAIERDGVGATRGALRDAITLLDENAVLLACSSDDVLLNLQQHRWHEALVQSRQQWGVAIQASVFGHALLQKLCDPYKGICAQAYALQVDPSFFTLAASAQRAVLDRKLVQRLTADHASAALAEKPFSPLPVLGIPGWWEANQNPSFYADLQVFRPKLTER